MMNKWTYAVLYLASILLGNIFVEMFGIISIWKFSVPAGVVFIGLTFTARDFVQRYWGDLPTWGWMILATVITIFMNWKLALASGLAFLFSESLDWLVFRVMKVGFKRRIIVSNLFSCPIDSLIFVTIAFGFMPWVIISQAIFKYASGLLILPLIKSKDKMPEKFKDEVIESITQGRLFVTTDEEAIKSLSKEWDKQYKGATKSGKPIIKEINKGRNKTTTGIDN